MSRIGRFQETIQPDQGILLSTANDIAYFTHFEFLVPEEREAFVFFTSKKAFLICSAFSPTDVSSELTVLRGTYPSSLAKHIQDIAQSEQLKQILYQGNSLFVDELETVKSLSSDLQFSALPPKAVWNLRMVKDDAEITSLRKACQIVSQSLNTIEQSFKVGVTELQLTQKLAELFNQYGADKLGFPTIVAFGAHATSPHHQPDNTPLTKETSILIDCGAMVDGYRSDMTRTWWFGKKPDSEFLEIEEIVQAAYAKSFQLVQHREHTAVMAKDVDAAARSFIAQAGYGEMFIHTTGHGVGLDIHEPPSLSWGDSTVLKPGMVITIEPGIYLDQQFGYRFENTVLITEDGAVELTNDNPVTNQ